LANDHPFESKGIGNICIRMLFDHDLQLFHENKPLVRRRFSFFRVSQGQLPVNRNSAHGNGCLPTRNRMDRSADKAYCFRL
jgi:hypothetical protein